MYNNLDKNKPAIVSCPRCLFSQSNIYIFFYNYYYIIIFFSFFFLLRYSIEGVAYVTVFNSSGTWAATFRLRGYKCVLVILCVSIIHRTLTWTTGSLTCVHSLSYACIWGLATPTSQYNIFTPKNSQILLVLLTGFEPRVFGSRSDALPIEPPRHHNGKSVSVCPPHSVIELMADRARRQR